MIVAAIHVVAVRGLTALSNRGFKHSLLWYPTQGIVVIGWGTWTGHTTITR